MNHTAKGRVRLLLERLEDRTLLSAAPNVIDLSTLHVDTGSYNTSDILVQFRTDSAPRVLLPGTTLGHKLDLVSGLYEVGLATGVTVEQALAGYRASPTVQSAELDYSLNTQGVPNDPKFGQQWALNNTGQDGGKVGADIHALQAWTVTTGSPTVTVAVMDTGIDYAHPDLYQNIWINQAEIPKTRLKNLVDVDHDGVISFADLNNPINQGPGKITDIYHTGRIDARDILAPMVLDGQGHDTGQGGWAFAGNTQDGDTAHPNDFIGWNFVANTNNPFDDNAHGTHVAGTIGAMGNDGLGVTGIDWQVSLMAVKFLNAQGRGSIGAFIDGLNYSLAHGAKITNNSWSGAGNSQALSDAINNARNHGQIFVAAAGNGGTNTDVSPSYPSSFPLDNIVSVAASDRYDHLAAFSDFGVKTVSLAAPGVGILSTTPASNYESWDGTSMATPQVTGVLALVWAKHPTWTYKQVIDQVLKTVDVLPAFQGKTATGGRLDAAAALGAAPAAVAPQVLGSLPSGPSQNTLASVRVTFSAAINPATFAPSAVTLTGPGGQVIKVGAVTAVPNSGGKLFDVTFATQTASGAYTFILNPAIRDTNGNALRPYKATFTIAPVSTFSSTGAVTVPSLGKAASTIAVNQDLTIGGVQVRLNISDGNDNALYIHLTSPAGLDILLSNRRGGSGRNYTNTLFADDAPASIRTGSAPFTGSFQSETPLAFLYGKNARGAWRLWVEDRTGSAAGAGAVITNWSLTIIAAPGTVRTQSLTDPPVGGPGDRVSVAVQGIVLAASSVPAAAVTSAPAGDVWRALETSGWHASAPDSAAAGAVSGGQGPVSDRVFTSPGSAGAMRATAWLSRLSGAGHEAEHATEDVLGGEEEG